MRKLRDLVDVEPVEYPSTRAFVSSAQRAADLMSAFQDPTIGAILSTSGGQDQITVLPHLDPDLIKANPKPFLGYSDNTNLLNWLWFHGIGGFYGGSTQIHVGPGPGIDPIHLTSLRAALFGAGELEIPTPLRFTEEELPWSSADCLTEVPPDQPASPWSWHHADHVVSATTWGGNLETLFCILAAGQWVLPNDAYTGTILLLETSEEHPSATEVFRFLMVLGERGLLEQFEAVVVARARAVGMPQLMQPDPGAPIVQVRRDRYRKEQEDAVLRALDMYRPATMVVVGVDFGHTSPQWVMPYGGQITIDGPGRRITATY